MDKKKISLLVAGGIIFAVVIIGINILLKKYETYDMNHEVSIQEAPIRQEQETRSQPADIEKQDAEQEAPLRTDVPLLN